MTFSPKVWGLAMRRLQEDIPEFVFDAWIAPLAVKLAQGRIVLGCPTSFHRDRVRIHYVDAITRCLAESSSAESAALASDASGTSDGTLPVPQIELLTMSEFDKLDGDRLDASAAQSGSMSRPMPPQSPQDSEQTASRVGMRKVEAPVRALAANGGASTAPDRARRGPELRGGVRPAARPGAAPQAAVPIAPVFTATPAASVASASNANPSLRPAEGGASQPTFQTGERTADDLESASAGLPEDTPRATESTRNLRAVPTGGRSPLAPAVPHKQVARVRNDARDANPTSREDDSAASQAPRAPRTRANRRGASTDTHLDLDLDGAGTQPELPFSFESFIVGPCNALAREAALALARQRQRSLNQLYLGGETGMGKTHLARATAIEARRHGHQLEPPSGPATRGYGRGPSLRSQGRPGIVYTTAEQFTSEFVSAMRNGRSEEFKKRYRGPIGLLIVEDVQFFQGRTKTQLELFHTVEHVLDAGGRVLLTGDRSPRDLGGLDERMRTQVGRGFVAELETPDAIVRRHILRSKAAAGGVHLPPDCLDLLVDATQGSVRDIESVLIQVVTTSSLLGRPIDLDLTREAVALKSGAGSTLAPKTIAVSEIVRLVAAFFGKRPEALASRSRRRDVLVPRQLAMYLAHRYTDASLTEIGRCLGRDHPAVRNAIARVERLVLENAPMRYQVEALSERVDQTLKNQVDPGGPAE